MSILERHPWSQSFQLWLTANNFKHRTISWARPIGKSKILLLGRLSDDSRPTLIFLHGLGNDALFPNIGFFRYVLSMGFNIVTCDLDGHGIGGSTEFSFANFDGFVEDLVCQLDKLNQGVAKYHFCGYSFGAVLQLNFAVQQPQRVASLTLIGMPTDLSLRILVVAEALTPLFKSYREALADYGIFGITPAIGSFKRDLYPVRLSKTETDDYIRVAAKIISNIGPLTLLPNVGVPTLLVVGSLDFIANQECGLEAAPNLQIEHVTLKGETHFSTMISKELAHAFVDFIETQGAK